MRRWWLSGTGGAHHDEDWEARLRAAARGFPYPPTPDVAEAVRRRLQAETRRPATRSWRLVWTALAALLILGSLLAVPQVRAAVLQALRLGAIQILPEEPTPTATLSQPTATVSPQASGTPRPAAGARPLTATPRPSSTPLPSVLNLAGETSLADAREETGFPVRLPAYPPDLGPPDRVFLQNPGGPMLVLVWLEPGQPDQVRLSLHQFGPGTFAQKFEPELVEETTVNGQRALWTEGPYLLQILRNGRVDLDLTRLVSGHVLIWVEGDITYRLETDLPLEEAVRIAESLE